MKCRREGARPERPSPVAPQLLPLVAKEGVSSEVMETVNIQTTELKIYIDPNKNYSLIWQGNGVTP